MPSLNDELSRIRLFIIAGQVCPEDPVVMAERLLCEVALQQQLLAQADTLFKATILTIPEVEPKRQIDNRSVSTATALTDLIVKFAGVLVRELLG